MKKKMLWKVLGGVLVVVTIIYTIEFTAFFRSQDVNLAVEPMLTTNWHQLGGFEKFTPDSSRIGCWGTAFSQIFYHHRLQPYGKVSYQGKRSTFQVNEDLEKHAFQWGDFRREINADTPLKSIDEMARYSYYTSAVLKKDFGSNFYLTKLPDVNELEAHYKASIKEYISMHKTFPYTITKLGHIIINELDEHRPVYLYFGNMEDYGHAVVVDGYRWENEQLWLHLMQGQENGSGNGWYKFDHTIQKDDDDILRVLYTVKPKAVS